MNGTNKLRDLTHRVCCPVTFVMYESPTHGTGDEGQNCPDCG